MTTTGALRAWHTSQLGGDVFNIAVGTVEEAARLLTVLACYDLYLGERVQGNMQGLEVWDGEAWVEWVDAEERDIGTCQDHNGYTAPNGHGRTLAPHTFTANVVSFV